MAPITEPKAELLPLYKADGSATYSHNGYTVTGAVNGPIEAQRRDENPFEAVIDVNVRPATGVGGTAERQLESILQRALRQLIPIRNFPRSLIQITLQVMGMPENAYTNTKFVHAQLNLALIPALLHAAILSLLTAAVPLKSIATAVTLALLPSEPGRGADGDGDGGGSSVLVVDPDTREADAARSLHVLGYTSSGDELILAESEGFFSLDEWENVLRTGQDVCCCRATTWEGGNVTDGDGGSGSGRLESASIKSFIRCVVEAGVTG